MLLNTRHDASIGNKDLLVVWREMKSWKSPGRASGLNYIPVLYQVACSPHNLLYHL